MDDRETGAGWDGGITAGSVPPYEAVTGSDPRNLRMKVAASPKPVDARGGLLERVDNWLNIFEQSWPCGMITLELIQDLKAALTAPVNQRLEEVQRGALERIAKRLPFGDLPGYLCAQQMHDIAVEALASAQSIKEGGDAGI